MLTPEHADQWAKEVSDAGMTLRTAQVSMHPWAKTIIAVDKELTVLRKKTDLAWDIARAWKRRVTEAAMCVVGDLEKQVETQRAALKAARVALGYYATPCITTDYTGDEWERVTSPDTARQAIVAIDAALGSKEKESKGDEIPS